MMGKTMTAQSHATISPVHQRTIKTSNLHSLPTGSMFLSLPLEIRIQIYSNVLESNPARHAHLSPSPTYPEASSSALFLKAITVPVTEQFSDGIDVGKTDPQPFPSVSSSILGSCFSPSLRGTGCGCIPTALLMTCKQVYEEARTLPWERNEYVFINWFCSGVYAARSFMRALKPWQRESMRFARLEVLRRDLEGTWVSTMVGGRPETGEWKDLCRLWSGDVETGESGLWGLKLGIKGSVGTYVVGEAIDGSGGVSVALAEPKTEKYNVDKRQNGQKGLLDINAQWITDGLTHMTSLRWLEIEIEDDDVSRDAKVDFCLNLGNKLSYISGIRVEILFVEKLVEEAKVTTQDERVWGQPGDDYIWGLDM